MCLNYRTNRVKNIITEIEEESQSNQTSVKTAMTTLREIIDKQEETLLQTILDDEKDQKKSVEEYKRQLQREEQQLIEQILNFVIISKDKQPKKLLDAKKPFDDYRTRTEMKLLDLKPLTRNRNYIKGLDKFKEIENHLQNLKLDKIPKHQNLQLQQRLTNNNNQTTLDLNSANLTDQDMEIIANELQINRVRK